MFAVAPLFVSAQETDEIAILLSVINDLLAQVAELERQIAVLTEGSIPSAPAVGVCPIVHLTYTLSLGSTDAETNGEVSALQTFLAQDPSIYPEGLITGYFGRLTQQAVQRWQIRHGIVSGGTAVSTGFGVVGPLTRASILSKCGSVVDGVLSPAVSEISIGDRVMTTDKLNVRSAAGLTEFLLGVQPTGSSGTVIEGPRDIIHRWWRVDYDAGQDGWSAGDWLVKVSDGVSVEDGLDEEEGNEEEEESIDETTPPTDEVEDDSTFPVISSIVVSGVTTSGAVVSWNTSEAATGSVEYGTSLSYGSSVTVSAANTTHSVTLSGLSSNVLYHVRIQAVDDSGNEVFSEDIVFTTLEEVASGQGTGFAWNSYFGTNSNTSQSPWRTWVRGAGGIDMNMLSNSGLLDPLVRDVITVVAAGDGTVAVRGFSRNSTPEYLDLIDGDNGAAWKDMFYNTVLELSAVPNSGRIYYQIGNEINTSAISEGLRSWTAQRGISLPGSAQTNDPEQVPYFVEYFLAPTVEAIRDASAVSFGSADAIPVILGSVAGANNPDTRDWIDVLLSYRIGSDSSVPNFAPSLAGKAVYEIVDVVAIHYLITNDGHFNDANGKRYGYKGSAGDALSEIWDQWNGVGKIEGLWNMEEGGKNRANDGRGR